MADYRSSTMELNSILEEARSRKNGSTPAKKTPAQRGASGSASSAKSAPRKTAPAQRSFNDDFIITDDGGDRAPVKKASRPAPSAKSASGKKSAPGKKKKTGLIVTLCIVGVLLIAGIGGLTLYLTSGSGTGPQSTFSDNVYVNGKSLKGLTMDQARALMADVENSLADGIKIELKAGDKTFNYTKDDFQYTFDTEAVLAQAKTYSEEKGIKTEDKNFEIKLTIDENSCKDAITKAAGEVKTEPKNAEVTAFDPSAASMFTISPETKGVSMDEAAGLKVLTEFIGSGKTAGTVEVPVTQVDPEYTAAFLKDNIRKLSSFSTYSTNNANGNENMRISLAACNGSIIEPGATWSFNDCTGNSNLESNGYKPAGVIINGKSETGIGGGICQSSTTIYNAAILCGMDVVERQCHYYKSVYVDAGRDATVDYGNIDLKVSNPFKYQLFMKCWMDGVELNCEIYGLPSADFDDVEISTTSPTYFDRGYRVYTTRTYYKGGKAVASDDLPSSTYYTSAPSSGSGSSSSDDDDSSSSSAPDTSSSVPDGGSSTPADGGETPGDGGGETPGGDDGGGEAPIDDGGGDAPIDDGGGE